MCTAVVENKTPVGSDFISPVVDCWGGGWGVNRSATINESIE